MDEILFHPKFIFKNVGKFGLVPNLCPRFGNFLIMKNKKASPD